VLHRVAEPRGRQRAGGVEDHLLVFGIQRLAMAHGPGDDRGVRERDVTRIEGLGGRVVLRDVTRGADQDHRVLAGQRDPVQEPRHRRQGIIGRPALVAVPFPRLLHDQRGETLLRLEQFHEMR